MAIVLIVVVEVAVSQNVRILIAAKPDELRYPGFWQIARTYHTLLLHIHHLISGTESWLLRRHAFLAPLGLAPAAPASASHVGATQICTLLGSHLAEGTWLGL